MMSYIQEHLSLYDYVFVIILEPFRTLMEVSVIR